MHYILSDPDKMSMLFREKLAAKQLWTTTDNSTLYLLTSWVSPDVTLFAIAVGSSFHDDEDKTEEFVEVVGALAGEMGVELPRNWKR
jgi:hypothetical protein